MYDDIMEQELDAAGRATDFRVATDRMRKAIMCVREACKAETALLEARVRALEATVKVDAALDETQPKPAA